MAIISVTGHRPHKLGGYAGDARDRLRNFAIDQLQLIPEKARERVITGMAQGWDQAVAWACMKLNIPYIAAIPYVGQENVWPRSAQKVYKELLLRAEKIVAVSGGEFAPWKLQKRNEWMVDQLRDRGIIVGRLVALWDGSTGGTHNCIQYAQRIEVPFSNIWQAWERYR